MGGTGKAHDMQIQTQGGLSKEEIEKMQQEAEQFAEEDKKKREAAEVRNTADSTLWRVESTLEEHDDKIDDELKQEIKSAMDELKDVMDSNEPDTIKEKTDALLAAERKVGDKIY